MPVQAPMKHAMFVQAWVCHWPVVSQVRRLFPEHSVAPGEQTPEQLPPTHAWPGQVDGLPQLPLAPHVSTSVSLPVAHCVEPGTHTPMQALPTHAEFVQGTPGPHCKSIPQV
jgi:hypothetical protein